MNLMIRSLWSVIVAVFLFSPLCWSQEYRLRPGKSPADNPMKGIVPYAKPHPDRFPHSMEFSYLAMSQLMKSDELFDWGPMEELLNDIASRGNQAIVRIFLEYPGKKAGIPQYLIDQGLKVHRYQNTNTAPFPPTEVATPDYQDPNLRRALRIFIEKWGEKYDGDPRLAYITAGLLGTWGEWHTHPRSELWATKEVQKEVLDAYQAVFKKTPILLRYPAGNDHFNQTENASLPFGYHDDSFAWATLDTGKKEDDWFYLAALKKAGPKAEGKWKEYPIGGEIRPEVWGKVFDDPSQWPKNTQDINQCISQTHATWLMDTGLFEKKPSEKRAANATREVQRMGYDFYLSQANFEIDSPRLLKISLQLKNQGVAPWYADWPTEIGLVDLQGELRFSAELAHVPWKDFLPRDTPYQINDSVKLEAMEPGEYQVVLRMVHPLPNGKPLRFANEDQDRHIAGWLSLGKVKCTQER